MNDEKVPKDSDEKVFKDPVYGYIRIPRNIVSEIIDTSTFQRLRRIAQTSFSPLYPSSNHNRFEHSIGVYTLGKIAGNVLTAEINKKLALSSPSPWDRINEIFSLACLLHDVGHAPFSHTGENFYIPKKIGNPYNVLHEQLFVLVKNAGFKKDILDESIKPAAAHEIMSAIVGLQKFSKYFKNVFEKEFFARCITGYNFSKDDDQHHLYNCYIALLNSRVLDVDRLDYLIRDAFFTGFDTVSLDYQRLLSHITVTKGTESGVDDTYKLAFYKGAISVIENFVYAHDSERKWIQNQPTILYDMYIIQYVISQLDKTFSTDVKKLFSYESISEAGQTFDDGLKISLLCDDDIISLMKTHCFCEDNLSKEYFSRQDRKRPFWKTEAEYKAFFPKKVGVDTLNDLKGAMADTEEYLRNNSDEWIINDGTVEKIETELTTINEQIADDKTDAVYKKLLETQRKVRKNGLKVMKCLQKYARSCRTPCNFVILNTKQFYSGFNTADFYQINIVFPSKVKDVVQKFNDVVTSLSGTGEPNDSFFYIFYNRSMSNKVEKEAIQGALAHAFLENC